MKKKMTQTKPQTETRTLALTPQERAQECERQFTALLAARKCRPVLAQRTIDGRLHLLEGVQVLILFVPEEVGQKTEMPVSTPTKTLEGQ